MKEINLNVGEETPGKKEVPDLTDVVKVICDSFDWEIIRLKLRRKGNGEDTTANYITSWIFEKYLQEDYSMFFTLRNLQQITESVFRDVVLRTFLLNLTERVAANLALLPDELVTNFKEKIVSSIESTRIDPNVQKHVSLILDEILSTYSVEKDSTGPLLRDNLWLLILHQLLHHLHTTVSFKELVENMKPEKSPVQPT